MKVIIPLICSLISAGITVGSKLFTLSLHPATFAFLRYGLTVIFILPLVLLYKEKTVFKRRFVPLFIFLGFILVVVFNGLYFSALRFSSATSVTLVGATNPILTMVATAILLQTLPTKYQLGAFLLSFMGVALVITEGCIDFGGLHGSRGEVCMLLAVICQVTYAMTLKKISTYFSPIILAWAPLVCGILMIFPFLVNQEYMSVVRGFEPYEWVVLSGIGLGSAVDIVCYSFSIKYMGPAWTNLVVFSSMPLFVFILEYLLLGKCLALYTLLGGFLIIASLFVGLYFRDS